MIRPIVGIQIEDQPERFVVCACLWGEARGESVAGMLAVLWVIANRAKKRGSTQKQEVLRHGDKTYQFTSFDPRDKNRAKLLSAYALDAVGWARCESVIELWPYTQDPTKGSDHYYNPDVAQPAWGRGHKDWQEKAVIGRHVFGVCP